MSEQESRKRPALDISVWNLIDDEEMGRWIQTARPRHAVPIERMMRAKSIARVSWKGRVRKRNWKSWTYRVGTAAAIAVLLALILQQRSLPPNAGQSPAAFVERIEGDVRTLEGPVQPGASIPNGGDLKTGPEGYAGLQLQSGGFLRLSTSTQLRFISSNRIFLRRGTIYLDSGPRKVLHALQIETEVGLVKEIGTQFQVTQGAESVELRVREGQVTLETGSDRQTAVKGIELIAMKDKSIVSQSIPVYGQEWDWILKVSPAFSVEGRTLDEYLEWVSRETGLKIWYADESLAKSAPQIILHGSIGNLKADRTPSVILAACGLRSRNSEGLLIVERKHAEAANQ